MSHTNHNTTEASNTTPPSHGNESSNNEEKSSSITFHPAKNTTKNYGAIIIMGVSGSGKSTVGRLLSNELSCKFLEGDDFHGEANVAKMRNGHALNDEDRWPWLDRLAQAMKDAVSQQGVVVVSCSALKKTYRERLTMTAPTSFVLLDVDRSELLRRMQHREHFMPVSLLDSQLSLLERPTSEEKALIITASATPPELCKIIREWLHTSTK